jgi:pyrrolidone-carboxylate peptidase
MVDRFSTNPYVNPDGWQGENWGDLGYDIYSFVAKEYYNNNGTWEMRYQQVWNEFWDIVNQIHPIAIIGFGQGAKENTWRIENKAVNWKKWYLDEEGNQPTPNPPDETVCPGYIRFSTLPIRQIEKAINNQTTINAEINYLGTPGFYLCGYIAYLQIWYQTQHSKPDDEFLCKAAGFIHVNKSIALNDCIEATNITIRETVEKVKKNIIAREINPVEINNGIFQTKSNLLLFLNQENKLKYYT